jgi:hypothetical protein
MSASFLAAQNNATFTVKQRALLGGAARMLSALSDAKGKSVAGRRSKVSRALRKLLKTPPARGHAPRKVVIGAAPRPG